MFLVFLTILPIFALVLVGWLARRGGLLGPTAASELNRFVVYLALPSLLFDIVANARWTEIYQPGFMFAFGAGSLCVFGIAVTLGLRRHGSQGDAAVEGLIAGYANTGFLGFPLVQVTLGPSGLAPTLIATILTACVVFALGIVLIEIATQQRRGERRLARRLAKSLALNPLLAAPALALVFPLCGGHVPSTLETFVKLLGSAASPAALVTLGLFLAARDRDDRAAPGQVAMLVGIKLLLHPLAVALLAILVGLPPTARHAAILLAALPTGTGPFMLAEFYQREAALTARTILVSTVLSMVTISLYLTYVR